MRMRSYHVPGEPKITDALNSVATGLENFLGNTPPSAGFRASLAEWRSWRDAAFAAGESLNRSPYDSAAALKRSVARAKKVRAKSTVKKPSVKSTAKPKMVKPKRGPVPNVQQRKADRAKFLAAMIKKYGKVDGVPEYREGRWYLLVWAADPTNPSRKTWVERSAKAKS
jgi:hypothetical protein